MKDSQRHWLTLRQAICKRHESNHTKIPSTPEFFQLFPSTAAAEKAIDGWRWKQYKIPLHGNSPSVLIREKCELHLALQDLVCHRENKGVDNTGNIKMWSSEQVLLYFILSNRVCQSITRSSESLNVCELGSGMSAFASFGLLAHAPVPFGTFWITDGNEKALENVQQCLEKNVEHFKCDVDAHVRQLLWNHAECSLDTSKRGSFDLIIASDCLFFRSFHADLAQLIRSLLRPDTGLCILLQPKRGKSMDSFVEIACQVGLSVSVRTDYDPFISKLDAEYTEKYKDAYKPDIHYPVLIEISLNEVSST